MKLIPDWRDAYKKSTVWVCLVAGMAYEFYTDILNFTYSQLPIIAQYMPADPAYGKWLPWLIIALRIVSFKKAK